MEGLVDRCWRERLDDLMDGVRRLRIMVRQSRLK